MLFLFVLRGVDEAKGLSTKLESDSESESLESESDPDVESESVPDVESESVPDVESESVLDVELDPELTITSSTSCAAGFWDAPIGFVVSLEGWSDSDSELELD